MPGSRVRVPPFPFNQLPFRRQLGISDVIDQTNIGCRKRLLRPLGDQLIGPAWFGFARGVIVLGSSLTDDRLPIPIYDESETTTTVGYTSDC
jgi:hypothetical protein